MIIESALTKQEFVRHALTRHFRRPAFYLYAFVAAVLTTIAFLQDEPSTLLLAAAWLPILIYGVGGWVQITRRSRDASLPLYLPTRYEFGKSGVEISSRQGRSTFSWADFRGWRKVVGLYELALANGQLLVFSQRAVAPRQVAALEELLTRQIKPGAEHGVFDQ